LEDLHDQQLEYVQLMRVDAVRIRVSLLI